MQNNEPKILIWDLETAGPNSLDADLSSTVCFGYKWFGEKASYCMTVDQFPGWFSNKGINDKPLLKAALKIMNEADLLVAHFGDRFDKPYFYGRCLLHNLTPPPPTKQRDTCIISWKTFKFSSSRLQNLADILKCSTKKYRKEVPDEWPQWWISAMAGNTKAIHDMAEYCRQDVLTLEQVYTKLRPYDTSHPRLVLNRSRCGICGGAVEYRGFAYVGVYRYRRFRCTQCGHWDRETKKVK